ncbi:MAG: hypothetical protein AAFV45_16060 [Pseudomonadota bacterium]
MTNDSAHTPGANRQGSNPKRRQRFGAGTFGGAIAVALCALPLAGCLEQSTPGVYPGPPDEALSDQDLKKLQQRAKGQR